MKLNIGVPYKKGLLHLSEFNKKYLPKFRYWGLYVEDVK
jgi:hypothetical protein